MRYKVSASPWKRKFCPECKSSYRFPQSASMRLRRGRIIVTCGNCGKVTRYPFKH